MDLIFYHKWDFWVEIIKIIFAIIGASWVYKKYKEQNEDEAKLEFDVKINNIGSDENSYLIELEAILINKGKIREKIIMNDFNFTLLKHEGEKFVNDKLLHNHVVFDKIDDYNKILWINSKIDNKKDYIYINGETQQIIRFYCAVSKKNKYVLLFSKIKFQDKEKDYQSAQKIIKLFE